MGFWVLAGLLTLAWAGVVAGRRRVPAWLVPAIFGVALVVFAVGTFLMGAAGPNPAFGDWQGSGTGLRSDFAGELGFVCFASGFFALLWCVVLAVVSLPVGLLLARWEPR